MSLPTIYQQFIHLSRYARWLDKEERRESWEETVKRYFDFFEKHLEGKPNVKRDRKIEELSKGNQQKIQFILSLIHDPDLLILDEPFTGLDPLNQLLLKEIIQEKRSDGKTILFSTHQMEQVERLCTNICLINKGKIIIEGSLVSVKQSHRSNAVDVRFSGELNSEKAKTYFSDVKIEGASLSGVLSCDPRDFLSWINTCVTVESFQIQVPSLEQIFIEEVKKAS